MGGLRGISLILCSRLFHQHMRVEVVVLETMVTNFMKRTRRAPPLLTDRVSACKHQAESTQSGEGRGEEAQPVLTEREVTVETVPWRLRGTPDRPVPPSWRKEQLPVTEQILVQSTASLHMRFNPLVKKAPRESKLRKSRAWKALVSMV